MPGRVRLRVLPVLVSVFSLEIAKSRCVQKRSDTSSLVPKLWDLEESELGILVHT